MFPCGLGRGFGFLFRLSIQILLVFRVKVQALSLAEGFQVGDAVGLVLGGQGFPLPAFQLLRLDPLPALCQDSLFFPPLQFAVDLRQLLLLDFTQRVAREKLPPHLSPEITQCVQFLRGHLFGTVGIDEAAGWVGKSRAWLTRKFKEEMGQSFGEFQSYLRTQEAKRLLRYTDISLSEIAGMLGFSSQAYFHSFFKKAVGMTPSEFRKQ